VVVVFFVVVLGGVGGFVYNRFVGAPTKAGPANCVFEQLGKTKWGFKRVGIGKGDVRDSSLQIFVRM